MTFANPHAQALVAFTAGFFSGEPAPVFGTTEYTRLHEALACFAKTTTERELALFGVDILNVLVDYVAACVQAEHLAAEHQLHIAKGGRIQ